MPRGKHTSNYKSFEDLEETRRERSRKKQYETKQDDNFNIHTDLNSNSEDYDDEYDDYDDSMLNRKKIIIVIVGIIFVIALIFGVYKLIFSNKKSDSDVVSAVSNENEISQSQEEKMPSVVSGYKVLGQVIINNLGIDQYILDSTEDNALENGVIKLYGPSLNSYGNFCIAGHNYEGVFKNLENINVGDQIVIKDTKSTENKYKVTSVENVEPDQLECLLQNTEKVEITLITCKSGSTSRIIVKAEKISEDNG